VTTVVVLLFVGEADLSSSQHPSDAATGQLYLPRYRSFTHGMKMGHNARSNCALLGEFFLDLGKHL
jgi:hypothetical protein